MGHPLNEKQSYSYSILHVTVASLVASGLGFEEKVDRKVLIFEKLSTFLIHANCDRCSGFAVRFKSNFMIKGSKETIAITTIRKPYS